MSKFSDDVFFYLNEGKYCEGDCEFSGKKASCKTKNGTTGCEASCKTRKCVKCSDETEEGDADSSDEGVEASVRCPKCGKKKCECSDNTEEMNTLPKSKKGKDKPAKDFGSTPEEKEMIDFIKNKKGKKAKCSVDTEAYDGRHFDKDPETNETKTKGSMKGYDIGTMSTVRDGRKPNLDKYKDYDEDSPDVDPETNETKTKGSMEGYKLKEEILRTTGYII